MLNQSNVFFYVIIVAIGVTLIISIISSHQMSKKLDFVNKYLIYLLPVLLLIVFTSISWIPSAYVAGLSFGLIAVYKLPSWFSYVAFPLFSMLFSLLATWVITYPILSWLNSKRKP